MLIDEKETLTMKNMAGGREQCPYLFKRAKAPGKGQRNLHHLRCHDLITR